MKLEEGVTLSTLGSVMFVPLPLLTAPLKSRVPVRAFAFGRVVSLCGGAAAPKLCIVERAHAAAEVGENNSSGAPLVTLC